jgi:hypothetical protein
LSKPGLRKPGLSKPGLGNTARWLKPGRRLFIQETDFDPTLS